MHIVIQLILLLFKVSIILYHHPFLILHFEKCLVAATFSSTCVPTIEYYCGKEKVYVHIVLKLCSHSGPLIICSPSTLWYSW